jgi:hypothetical protein
MVQICFPHWTVVFVEYMNEFKVCINAVDPSYLKDGTIMKQFVVINVKAKNTTDNILFIYNLFAYLSLSMFTLWYANSAGVDHVQRSIKVHVDAQIALE